MNFGSILILPKTTECISFTGMLRKLETICQSRKLLFLITCFSYTSFADQFFPMYQSPPILNFFAILNLPAAIMSDSSMLLLFQA